MFDIQEELQKLPDQPGVYIMHDASDAIIYVGKARSLTKRVHQYFQASHDEGIKKKQMVSHIDYFEYIVTDSELEALVLECNLIKEHRPKYNTLLRDDKTYPYIKVTLEENYPRVLFSRQMMKDGNRYFGPFTSAGAVKDTIDLVQKLFHIRTCSHKFPENFGKHRPCLNYHMKQCQGICQGNITEEEYHQNIEEALDFLNGNYQPVEEMLKKKMEEAVAALEFEKAAVNRDLLESVYSCIERQKITNTDGDDRDIIAYARDEEAAVIQIFYIRNGRMIGREHFYMNICIEDVESSLLEKFIEQYYAGTPFVPKEIYLQEKLEQQETIEKYLSAKRGSRVYIKSPQKGQKEKLVELAAKNATLILSTDKERMKREEGRTIGACKEIAHLLGLPHVNRMEAFDISNTSGFLSVGSMVVFEKGKPKRSDYRKFRLKTVDGPDDYASMKEVLTRRFQHGKEEKERLQQDENASTMGFDIFPDVIMMDGGKGQVHVAMEVLEEMHLQIPVCGMVKDDHHRTRGLYYQNQEIKIDKSSEGFHLITRLQDEAHRFAIEYHRSLRNKGQVKSFLDDIEGIGPARRKALMAYFASADEMRDKTVEDFAAIPQMNQQAATRLYAYFHPKD